MEYKLRTETIQDIVNSVSQERLPELFIELQQLTNQLYAAKAMSDLMSVIAESSGGSIETSLPDVITWKDDGKGEVGVQMVNADTDDVFATICNNEEGNNNE